MKSLEEQKLHEKEFKEKLEKKRHSQLDVPTIYDEMHLNLGAEGQEEIFERDIHDIARDDPSFNDPK